MTNAPELRSALVEAAAHGHGTFVVDMTRTLFCDSSGLHILVAAYKRAQAEGGELRLAMPAGVLRVFELTGVDRVIPTFTSVEQALAHRAANEPNGGAVTGSSAAAEPIWLAAPGYRPASWRQSRYPPGGWLACASVRRWLRVGPRHSQNRTVASSLSGPSW
jgi:anti-sigma B factor antagonist